MGPLGVQETVFIFVLALLIFGPKKLPELGRTIGKAMSEFRRASSELKATFDREMNSIERENESLKEVTSQYALEEHSYNHDSYYDSGDYSGTYDNHTADHTSVSASAPQGADDQAGQPQTATIAHAEIKPADGTHGDTHDDTQPVSHSNAKTDVENPVGASDPHPVKS